MNSIELNTEQTRKLQLEILDLLVEFDRICRINHIRYFLSCGTLLGAVRHHGFIPWDDDADVEMLREDYEKFVTVCNEDIQKDKFFFQDSSTDSEYSWTYGKLRKRGTRYIRPGQSHLKQKDGICIDIFILDNISASTKIQRFMELSTRVCRKILWSKVGALRATCAWQRMLYKLLCIFPHNCILTIYFYIVEWYRDKPTGWLGFFNTEVRTKRGYAFSSCWYENSKECMFEGHGFYIPNGYDKILYLKYGDYMTFPPVEERRGSSPAEYIRFSDGLEINGG
ncbi:LicD family protein [Pectinatus frisingensis]|uniref:LicD family protein n=1 Tax=Pectinatus frisingensis TaxID=865 RepID=UPI0018C62C7C|nr:LicD family protein [Pectinatus frisingensis]